MATPRRTPDWLMKVQWAGWIVALLAGLSSVGWINIDMLTQTQAKNTYATKEEMHKLEKQLTAIHYNLLVIMGKLEVDPIKLED